MKLETYTLSENDLHEIMDLVESVSLAIQKIILQRKYPEERNPEHHVVTEYKKMIDEVLSRKSVAELKDYF